MNKGAYLLTKQDGGAVLLFDYKRAHGLAGHHGWTVKEVTAKEAKAHIRATLAKINA